jgi:hypothetical protein
MHPTLMYDYARAKIDDEQRAAERRRLAKVANESRPPRDGGSSIVGRVWALITGVGPAEPALSGRAG